MDHTTNVFSFARVYICCIFIAICFLIIDIMRSGIKGLLILTVLLIAFLNGRAQVCTTITMPDSAYACNHDTVSVLASYTTPTGYTVIDSSWSPLTGINIANFYNPVFTTGTTSQSYTLSILALTPNDFVQDGNFDSLNTNDTYFTSSYRDTAGAGSLWPEGYYSIQNNPFNVHPNFASFGDHTTGTGNMMVINGAGQTVDIWCQTILVMPGTYYDFSAWAASCTPSNPAVLQFKINGVLIDSPLHLGAVDGLWTEFHALWYSDTSTVITICINDQQTALSGNDFAIDDISFKLVCQSTASVYIAVPNLNDSIGFDQQPCQNGAVTLTAINRDNVYAVSTQYDWSFGDHTTASGTAQPHNYPNQNYYLVSLVVSDHSCVDTFTDIIFVNNFTPRLPVSADTSVCVGSNAQLWVGQGNTYQWTPATGLNDPSVQNPIASPQDTTTYYVTVHSDNGCIFYDTVTVNIWPLPVIVASPTDGVATCNTPTLQLNATGAQSYVWFPAQYVTDPLAQSPFAIPTETTIYTVTGTDANHCVNKDSITVQVPDISRAFVPSAFTPNGDGKNDQLRPVPYCGFVIQEFSVFNRWGERVWYSEATSVENHGWDGTINGSLAPMDTYFYVLTGATKDGIQKVIKGTAVLIR